MPRTPGQHGNTKNRYTKVSDYKRQLLEKQRLRCQYNIHERQMKNYYNKAVRKSGSTSDNLIQMLETRLDAVVLRGGLARTIYAARQYVNHGHILVNGRRVDIPSCQVRATDVVSVRPKSRRVPCFTEAMRSAKPPAYLDLNKPEMAVTLLYIPPRAEIPAICEMPLVIEFYSR